MADEYLYKSSNLRVEPGFESTDMLETEDWV